MTRRTFILNALPSAVGATSSSPATLLVPIHQVMDTRGKPTADQLQRFSANIWPEAVRDFSRCGIQLQTSKGTGEVRRSPGGKPIFAGLEYGKINLVVTDYIPQGWDTGRGLVGVSTQYEGQHLCVIALSYAHGHQVPFLSVNTCVHELLHVLLQDIFESRPKGMPGEGREFRIDWYATRLWLFHDGAAIRKEAQAYLNRLRLDVAPRT